MTGLAVRGAAERVLFCEASTLLQTTITVQEVVDFSAIIEAV
jgi:hypothetical protein